MSLVSDIANSNLKLPQGFYLPTRKIPEKQKRDIFVNVRGLSKWSKYDKSKVYESFGYFCYLKMLDKHDIHWTKVDRVFWAICDELQYNDATALIILAYRGVGKTTLIQWYSEWKMLNNLVTNEYDFYSFMYVGASAGKAEENMAATVMGVNSNPLLAEIAPSRWEGDKRHERSLHKILYNNTDCYTYDARKFNKPNLTARGAFI